MQSVRAWVQFLLGEGSSPLFSFIPADYLAAKLNIPTTSQLDNVLFKATACSSIFHDI